MKRINKNKRKIASFLIVILCCSIMPSQLQRVDGGATLFWEEVDTPRDIVYGNGIYVMYHDNQLSYSKNGSDWSVSMEKSGKYYGIERNLLFCGEYFWFSSNDGSLWISKDGVYWTKSIQGLNEESRYHVIYQRGFYILLKTDVCSASGNWEITRDKMYVSNDGKKWKYMMDKQDDNLINLVNAKGMTIAVGKAGRIAILGDDFQWKEVERVTKNDLKDIAYGNGCFIAVGNNGIILKSKDGLTWEVQQEKKADNFQSVEFSGDAFYAETSYGSLFYNEDCVVADSSWEKYTGNYTYDNGYLYEDRDNSSYYSAKLPENANTGIADLCLMDGFVSMEDEKTYSLVIADEADSIELGISLECDRASGWIETGDGIRYPIEKVNSIPVSRNTENIVIHVVAEDGITEEQYRAILVRKKIYHVNAIVGNGGFIYAPACVIEDNDVSLIAEEYPGYEFAGWKMQGSNTIVSQEKELYLTDVQEDVRYEALFRVQEGKGISVSANTTCARIFIGNNHDSSLCEEEINYIRLTATLEEESDAGLTWEVLNAIDSEIYDGNLYIGDHEISREIVVKVSSSDNPDICDYIAISIVHIGEDEGEDNKSEDTGKDDSGDIGDCEDEDTGRNDGEEDRGNTGGNESEDTGKDDSGDIGDCEDEDTGENDNGENSGNSGESVSENTGEEGTGEDEEDRGNTGGSVSDNTGKANTDADSDSTEDNDGENKHEDNTGKDSDIIEGSVVDNKESSDHGGSSDNKEELVDKNSVSGEMTSPNETIPVKMAQSADQSGLKKGMVISIGNLRYKITGYSGNGKKTVSVLGCKKQKKNIVIPGKIKYRGTSFQVTSIAAKAFRNKKKIRQITLGSNIKVIGKKAFSGIYAKALIKCPKSKKIKYTKMIKKSGIEKTVQIK